MTMEQIRAEITDWDVAHKSVYVIAGEYGVLWRVTRIGPKFLRVLNYDGQFKLISPDEVVEIRM